MKTYKISQSLIAILTVWLVLGCAEGDNFDYNKNVLYITGTEETPVMKFVVEDTPAAYPITVSSTAKVEEDVNVKFVLDPAAVKAYNAKNKTNFYPAPESAIVIEGAEVVINKGKAFSNPAHVKIVSTENLVEGRSYLIPLTVQKLNGKMDVLESSKTVFLKISQTIDFMSVDLLSKLVYYPKGDLVVDLPVFTVELKVYVDQMYRLSRPIHWNASNNRLNLLRFGEHGFDERSLQWITPDGSMVSNTRFQDNRWYLLSFVFDGSKHIMYVDGVKDVELQGTTGTTLEVMSLGDSRSRGAELRVWTKPLTAGQIKAGLCSVDPTSDGLLFYWKMNEGEGKTFHDLTGHGYDATYETELRWVKDVNNKCSN